MSTAASNAEMHYVRRGTGSPLLLLHGIGESWRSWSTILDALTAERDVIAVDLPGFGDTPPLPGDISVAALADAVTHFLDAHELRGIDCVGSSMGARLALELARRGVVGATVSLDPGGFWRGGEKTFFGASIALSIRVVRLLKPVFPMLTRHALGRTLLFIQFSARPWALPADVALTELESFINAPSFDPLLRSLVHGPKQQGAPAGSTPGSIVIGWGRRDRVCVPAQAKRALALFPDARIHWLDDCGHFPQWDAPAETVELILRNTGEARSTEVAARASREQFSSS